MTCTSKPSFNRLDQERDRLRDAYPGWHIWYVLHADGTVKWCAQPVPLLNCDSPPELTEEIEAARERR